MGHQGRMGGARRTGVSKAIAGTLKKRRKRANRYESLVYLTTHDGTVVRSERKKKEKATNREPGHTADLNLHREIASHHFLTCLMCVHGEKNARQRFPHEEQSFLPLRRSPYVT